MWLTRITLDTRRPDVRDDLGDTVKMHHRLMTLAEDDLGVRARQQAGMLYRIESTPSGTVVIVQTRDEPLTDRIPDGYGTCETRDLRPQLDALTAGTRVSYRIAANATKKLAGRPGEKTGRLVMLSGTDAEDWWRQRAAASGLDVDTVTSARQESARSGSRDRPIKHAITRFDGEGVITDPELLRDTIEDGIGRAKAFGCGLLSVTVVGG